MKKYLILIAFLLPVIFFAGCNREDNTIYTKADKDPQFPGGMDKFYKFLSDNIQYPVEERENNVQGRVIIAFVVEKDGSLGNFEILRGVSRHINNESIRVLKVSPKWKPAIINNKPVRMQYTIPIAFTLQDE